MLLQKCCCKICLLQLSNLRTPKEFQDLDLSALKSKPCAVTKPAMLSLSRRGRANGWMSMFPNGCLLQDLPPLAKLWALYAATSQRAALESYCGFTTDELFASIEASLSLVSGPRLLTLVATSSWLRGEEAKTSSETGSGQDPLKTTDIKIIFHYGHGGQLCWASARKFPTPGIAQTFHNF